MSWGNQTFEWPVKPNETVEVKYGLEPIELEILVPVKVQGEAIGDLMIYAWSGNWYVVHIPTQTRFDKAVPEGDWTKEQLINWCSQVQRNKLDYWKELARYTFDNYEDISIVTKNVIKDWCLSVSP